ncbi:hypothetical protein Y88_0055 [Novosphingobium nitrogenifigens DSM 19370]|uniref:Uncharacterized protein n=1 Tax=Novosphingobium nitrogenifigens DSM 19370 TaxID=983920 RepID=F1Z4Q5_9SPHN|nr:hypothetical protein Y88_0055 [Novosphingobium nitrogenifigens DSM 19370]
MSVGVLWSRVLRPVRTERRGVQALPGDLSLPLLRGHYRAE